MYLTPLPLGMMALTMDLDLSSPPLTSLNTTPLKSLTGGVNSSTPPTTNTMLGMVDIKGNSVKLGLIPGRLNTPITLM